MLVLHWLLAVVPGPMVLAIAMKIRRERHWHEHRMAIAAEERKMQVEQATVDAGQVWPIDYDMIRDKNMRQVCEVYTCEQPDGRVTTQIKGGPMDGWKWSSAPNPENEWQARVHGAWLHHCIVDVYPAGQQAVIDIAGPSEWKPPPQKSPYTSPRHESGRLAHRPNAESRPVGSTFKDEGGRLWIVETQTVVGETVIGEQGKPVWASIGGSLPSVSLAEQEKAALDLQSKLLMSLSLEQKDEEPNAERVARLVSKLDGVDMLIRHIHQALQDAYPAGYIGESGEFPKMVLHGESRVQHEALAKMVEKKRKQIDGS